MQSKISKVSKTSRPSPNISKGSSPNKSPNTHGPKGGRKSPSPFQSPKVKFNMDTEYSEFSEISQTMEEPEIVRPNSALQSPI